MLKRVTMNIVTPASSCCANACMYNAAVRSNQDSILVQYLRQGNLEAGVDYIYRLPLMMLTIPLMTEEPCGVNRVARPHLPWQHSIVHAQATTMHNSAAKSWACHAHVFLISKLASQI